jgi:hypothetical protein
VLEDGFEQAAAFDELEIVWLLYQLLGKIRLRGREGLIKIG